MHLASLSLLRVEDCRSAFVLGHDADPFPICFASILALHHGTTRRWHKRAGYSAYIYSSGHGLFKHDSTH